MKRRAIRQSPGIQMCTSVTSADEFPSCFQLSWGHFLCVMRFNAVICVAFLSLLSFPIFLLPLLPCSTSPLLFLLCLQSVTISHHSKWSRLTVKQIRVGGETAAKYNWESNCHALTSLIPGLRTSHWDRVCCCLKGTKGGLIIYGDV